MGYRARATDARRNSQLPATLAEDCKTNFKTLTTLAKPWRSLQKVAEKYKSVQKVEKACKTLPKLAKA